MSHTIRGKDKLTKRVRRVRGQIEALERALDAERPCGDVLQLIAAARGAMNSLMVEVLEDHIRHHVTSVRGLKAEAETEELVGVLRSYLK
ncbi:MAG: metal/formaldehyde-sensitive transcriptional repressor [Terriglobales bacterium]